MFPFLHKNICCGCSLELPRRGDSNEHQQHMFFWTTIENYPLIIMNTHLNASSVVVGGVVNVMPLMYSKISPIKEQVKEKFTQVKLSKRNRKILKIIYYFLQHKTNYMTYAPSRISDQRPPCLIRVFAVCSLGSQGPMLLHVDSDDSDQTVDAQADLSLCWAHGSFSWFYLFWYYWAISFSIFHDVMKHQNDHFNFYSPFFLVIQIFIINLILM